MYMLSEIIEIRREVMKINIVMILLAALCGMTTIAAGLSESRPVEITNPSFETGDLTGWAELWDYIWVDVQDDDSWWQSHTISDISPDGAGTD